MTSIQPILARGHGSQPILLLHGFLGSGRNLASLGRKLSEALPALRVLLPDLSGHGESPMQAAVPSLHGAAEALLELATAQALPQPFAVIGHSMGGRVALKMKSLAPDRVGAAACIDIAPGPMDARQGTLHMVFRALRAAPATVSSRQAMRQHFLDAGVEPSLTDWVLMNLVPRQGQYGWRFDRDWLAAFHRDATGEDLWPVAEQHGAALLTVAGGASHYVSAGDAQRLRQAGVQVEVVPGAGHFVHVDKQAELVACLIGWLGRQ